MPNYKQSTLPCSSYMRANSVAALNPLGGLRLIQFHEETVLTLPDGTTSTSPAGECSKILTAENAATPFPLRDPQTGDPTGTTMTYADVYQALMSLYYHVAEARDAEAAGV